VNAAVRVSLFAVILVLCFAGAYAAGAALDPDGGGATQSAPVDQDGHGERGDGH